MSSHALFHLLCHWMVWFKAKALFEPLQSVSEIESGGTFAMVIPQPHRGACSVRSRSRCQLETQRQPHVPHCADVGKAAMARVQMLKYTNKLAFTFQKQVYIYEKPKDGADNGHVTLATPAQLTGTAKAALESLTRMRSCRHPSLSCHT